MRYGSRFWCHFHAQSRVREYSKWMSADFLFDCDYSDEAIKSEIDAASAVSPEAKGEPDIFF